MGKRFLIGEIVGVAFHREAEPFRQHIVSCRWSSLSSVYIFLIGIVEYGLSNIGISLRPHVRVGNLIHGVQLIPPDRYLRHRPANTLKDVHQLHFDSVSRSVSDSAFGACGNDQIIIQLGCTLFDSANDVFSGIGRGKPLIYGGHLTAQSL